MNKSVSFAIVIVGLLSLHCGLQASPLATSLAEEISATALIGPNLAWLTAGAIGLIIGLMGIVYRRLG